MSKKILKKIIIVVVIIGLITVFKIFNLGDYLSLSFRNTFAGADFVLCASWPVSHNNKEIAGFV